MFRLPTALALLTLGVLAVPLSAADAIQARYITGGGYHDYQALAPVITAGIGRFAHVAWDIRFGEDALANKKLGDGVDVLVYNMCYEDANPDVVENLFSFTRAGKPTVLIHCSMHSFKPSDAWTECCGQRTRRHDSYRALTTTKADPEHPIVKTFPDHWKTPGDELYQTIKLSADNHPLLVSKGEEERENVVCWLHQYGKGRVFATTLGHDMPTASQADYHHLLANGLLWTCDKLDDNGQPRTGYAAEKP